MNLAYYLLTKTYRGLSPMPCERSFPDGKQTRSSLFLSAELMKARDEAFNSITGLNGSGKSNILDAICFVLGITNMTTVRAQNLQVIERDSRLSTEADAVT